MKNGDAAVAATAQEQGRSEGARISSASAEQREYEGKSRLDSEDTGTASMTTHTRPTPDVEDSSLSSSSSSSTAAPKPTPLTPSALSGVTSPPPVHATSSIPTDSVAFVAEASLPSTSQDDSSREEQQDDDHDEEKGGDEGEEKGRRPEQFQEDDEEGGERGGEGDEGGGERGGEEEKDYDSRGLGSSWTTAGLQPPARLGGFNDEEDEESDGEDPGMRHGDPGMHDGNPMGNCRESQEYSGDYSHQPQLDPRAYDHLARRGCDHPTEGRFVPVPLVGPRPQPYSTDEDDETPTHAPEAPLELDMEDYIFEDDDEDDLEAVNARRYEDAVFVGLDNQDAELKMAIRRMWQAVCPISFFLMIVLGSITVLVTLNRSRTQVVFETPSPVRALSAAPSTAPSMAPTLADFDSIVRFLIDTSVTNAEILRDKNSPQYKASLWMANQGTPTDHPTFVQRFVFALFFYATNGLDWCSCTACFQEEIQDASRDIETCSRHGAGYLTTTPECDWFGARCDEDGHINNLELVFNNLQNSLPSEIARLPKLQSLILPKNKLSGPLPPELGETQIQHFLLANNALTDPFPETFRNNPHVRTLSFGDNHISVFPSVVATLANLKGLRFRNNGMDGTLPMDIAKLENLDALDVSDNSFSGTIPEVYGNWRKLTYFNVGNNGLGGTVPEFLYRNSTKMEHWNVSNNQLSGTLSPAVRFLGSEAQYKRLELDFSENALDGTIPPEWGQITNLWRLRLHGNNLRGDMPKEICDLVKMPNAKLMELTVDCDKVHCRCCDCK